MKLYIFSKSGEKFAPNRLFEEAKSLGFEVEKLFYKNLSIIIDDPKVKVLNCGEELKKPDAAILRVSGAGLKGPLFVYQRVALLNALQGAFVVNGSTYTTWPRLNKLEQHYHLVENGLPVVPSFTFSSDLAIDWNLIKFPIIAKTTFGSSGRGVFKLNSKDEFLELCKEREINNLLFQKFLPTRQDYRVITIGGRALPKSMRKTAPKGEFLTNFARGGIVEGVETSNELRSLAEKTARAFKADYAGIDIMYDKQGKPYILEINRGAQFQGFEQATGINVARELVLYIKNKVLKSNY